MGLWTHIVRQLDEECTTLSCLAEAALITGIHITAHPVNLKLNTFQSDFSNNKYWLREHFITST